MLKQQTIMKTPKQLHPPLWKRLMLVIALFLSTGPLALMTSTQVAYASTTSPPQPTHSTQKEQSPLNIMIVCNAGKGGNTINKSGGAGGNCAITIPIEQFLTVASNVLNVCNTGLGGHGGAGSTGGIVTGSEAGGGPGGECIYGGDKGETGGAFSGATGGNVIFLH